jgi:cytochrome b561
LHRNEESIEVTLDNSLADTKHGYGIISRSLHWGMALLFVWQFVGAILRVYADDTPIEGFFWSTHYTVGFTLWLLVLARGAWGLANSKRRPEHEGPGIEKHLATAAHFALYVLMIVVPTLAIMRAIGNTRGFRVYGIQLVAQGGEPNQALIAPAGLLHGFLGWTLLMLVVGHVAMALHHGFVRKDGTLRRMVRGSSAASVAAE